MNAFERKLMAAYAAKTQKVRNKLKETAGIEGFVVVIIIVLVALVLGVTVFMPQTKVLFEKIFGGASSKVDSIINFS